MTRDPYEILGLPRTASPEDVRNAFRQLARKHHPDRNPDDPSAQERFQELNSAYQLLSDERRRARFDRTGSASRSNAPSPGPSGAGFGFGVEDIFSEIFGGKTRGATVSGDIRQVVELTFEEAALGCMKSLEYARVDHCQTCEGTGAEPGTSLTACRFCGGAGHVQAKAGFFFGAVSTQICPGCSGSGKQPAEACRACRGKGLSRRSGKVDVRVPAGIEHGAEQVVRGAGSRPRPRARKGDLALVIRVQPHPVFKREGDDVLSSVSVPFTMAALGGEVSVDTLHGTHPITIPAGTAHGRTLSLPGQGVPHRFRRGRGNHNVEVTLRVPKTLTKRAEELIAAFDEQQKSAENAGWFENMKGWFSD